MTPNTPVPEPDLDNAIMVWLKTKLVHLADFVPDNQDLYLRIVAEATKLNYEEVRSRFKTGDTGISAARHYVKIAIFTRLLMAPTSILQVHDEVIVQEHAAVESADAHEELEDHAGKPLHPTT